MATFRDDTDVSFLDDLPEGQTVKQVQPNIELGVTGIKRVGGYVDEEFLPALRGRKAVQVFKEMSLNDSMVGALLFAIDKLIREVEWKVMVEEQTPEMQEAQEFLEGCMEDMSHSWDDFIGEVLSCLVYGWSWHEIVYKKRMGPWETDPKKRSKYTDGKIGWRKIPIRSQETWMRWIFDEQGGIKAMVQMAPPRYQTTVLPIEKCLLFRTSIAKGNPEGVSLLRPAYRAWYFKKRLEEFEAIGVERDLAGMPVARVPADYLTAAAGTKQARTVDAFRKMVRGVRRDENEGLVLPTQYDQETKQPLFDFELMSSGGARQFDTTQIIQRYEQRILMAVLADFILVGHEGVGSYSMHTDKQGLFRSAMNSIVKAIADTLNRHAVPRLFSLNGWKLDNLPYFEPTNIDPPDLTQLAQFISSTAGAGMQWFPDPDLEKFVREIARLPEMSEETLEFKREVQMQDQAMQYAEGQMGILGMKQKAEMAAQGYTPEQAEMAAQMPTPEMEEQQMRMQQKPPEEDSPAAQAQFERDNAASERDAQYADKDLNREKEKMTLQEQVAAAQHKRQIELLREQTKNQSEQGKTKVQLTREQTKATQAQGKTKLELARAQAKKQAQSKKPAAKKTAAKKTPPKGKK